MGWPGRSAGNRYSLRRTSRHNFPEILQLDHCEGYDPTRLRRRTRAVQRDLQADAPTIGARRPEGG